MSLTDERALSNSTVSSCIIRSFGTVVYPESGATDGNREDSVSFEVVGLNGTSGFCRVMIPALLNGSFTVYVDEVNTTYSVLPCSNDTYKYLYFIYEQLAHEVTVIPEFSSLLILPLFVLATMFTTRICRRRTF